jgi:hypothetical protein
LQRYRFKPLCELQPRISLEPKRPQGRHKNVSRSVLLLHRSAACVSAPAINRAAPSTNHPTAPQMPEAHCRPSKPPECRITLSGVLDFKARTEPSAARRKPREAQASGSSPRSAAERKLPKRDAAENGKLAALCTGPMLGEPLQFKVSEAEYLVCSGELIRTTSPGCSFVISVAAVAWSSPSLPLRRISYRT